MMFSSFYLRRKKSLILITEKKVFWHQEPSLKQTLLSLGNVLLVQDLKNIFSCVNFSQGPFFLSSFPFMFVKTEYLAVYCYYHSYWCWQLF